MSDQETTLALADEIANWIAGHVERAGLTGAVVGLSGGIDSAVVAGLCARGLGAQRVLGVIMPVHSSAADAEHAEMVAKAFGIEFLTIDLSSIYDAFVDLLPKGSELADANIKPRLRMITLYHRANTLQRMVVGTGNRSELMVGYFTKYGDAGVDLLPIAGLYKYQVRELARQLGVPQPIISRPPSAGLWAGQTDEAEMGVTYEQLDRALASIETSTTDGVDPEVFERVEGMMRRSEHKRHLPPIFTTGTS